MSGMKPICANCKVEMERVGDDVAVWHPMEPLIEGLEIEIDSVMLGNMYECKKCGANIVIGFSHVSTAAECDQRILRKIRDRTKEQIRILR